MYVYVCICIHVCVCVYVCVCMCMYVYVYVYMYVYMYMYVVTHLPFKCDTCQRTFSCRQDIARHSCVTTRPKGQVMSRPWVLSASWLPFCSICLWQRSITPRGGHPFKIQDLRYVYMCMYVYVYVYVCMCIYVCIYMYNIYIYIMYIYIYIYIYIYMCVYIIYMCIYSDISSFPSSNIQIN